AQDYPDVEVLLVDQNPDGRLRPIVTAASSTFKIRHLRSERGLSRARNIALPHITGDVVAFPDDDCWYPPDLLKQVAHFLSENPECDGLTGCSADPAGRPSPSCDRHPGDITTGNVWRRAISFTIFLRRNVIAKAGEFDEALGVGAGTPWGSGEETDYLLRALAAGCRFHYDPSVLVLHPKLPERNDAEARQKAYCYAQGVGHVLRVHNYSQFAMWRMVVTPLKRAAYSLATGRPARAAVRWKMFSGCLAGYMTRVDVDERNESAPSIQSPSAGCDAEHS
ncbi:MAG TPA: glycosyltransferase family A protein, partial [Terriglobia bacterium]|nr:glycosyltransferase family A protein [Terriglobia bacterium]